MADFKFFISLSLHLHGGQFSLKFFLLEFFDFVHVEQVNWFSLRSSVFVFSILSFGTPAHNQCMALAHSLHLTPFKIFLVHFLQVSDVFSLSFTKQLYVVSCFSDDCSHSGLLVLCWHDGRGVFIFFFNFRCAVFLFILKAFVY